MSMSLHGLQQVGLRRFKPLPADAVGGFPNQDHRLPHGLAVDTSALDHWWLLLGVTGLPQQPDAVLTVVSGNRAGLVEDPAFLLLGRRPVAVSDRRQQLLFCHPADGSSHVAASRILGNILFEATTRRG